MVGNEPAQGVSSERGRVLLVDDDPQICHIFRKALERRGHTVFEARDGEQALHGAEQLEPEVILLDLNLPAMNGLELMGRLSRQCPEALVIIVSGTGRMEDAIAALRLGASDYLMKPVPAASVLTHAVESNLQRCRLIQLNRTVSRELEFQHRRIREDEEAGRRVQNRLFPPPDWSHGPFHFQHRVISSLLLSGDFVDYFSLDNGFVAFYCADVSGHGVSSALVTVLVKGLISKYRERYQDRADRIVLEPDRLLAQLNREICQEQLGKHLTVFYGVLNVEANALTYASGGHYPPPLLFSEGRCRKLDRQTMAVGLFPFAAFQAETVSLPPVFRLVVFSDGALEALTLPTPQARLAHLQTLSTAESLRAFVDEADANKHLPDDLTVLCITRGEMP